MLFLFIVHAAQLSLDVNVSLFDVSFVCFFGFLFFFVFFLVQMVQMHYD